MSRPEALRLADRLEHGRGDDVIYAKPAATELRRLHEVNADLLQALKNATEAIEHWGLYASDYFQQKWDLQSDINAARAAIAKAERQA